MSTIKVDTLTTVDGTHSVNVANLAEGDTTPAGTIINYGGTTSPEGYLNCDGTEVDQLTYPALYAAIGDAWATTGGAVAPAAGMFRLPPQSVGGLGLYMRGKGTTPIVGEFQGDVARIDGTFHATTHTNYDMSGAFSQTDSIGADFTLGGGAGQVLQYTLAGDPTETRPASITTKMCIKAFNGAINEENISITALANELNALKASQPDPKSLATAWVNFDANSAADGAELVLKSSFGVSKVIKISVGRFQVHFTTPMDNVNYLLSGAIGYDSIAIDAACLKVSEPAFKLTASCDVSAMFSNSSSSNVYNYVDNMMIFHGGKN